MAVLLIMVNGVHASQQLALSWEEILASDFFENPWMEIKQNRDVQKFRGCLVAYDYIEKHRYYRGWLKGSNCYYGFVVTAPRRAFREMSYQLLTFPESGRESEYPLYLNGAFLDKIFLCCYEKSH
jgi:hypothetical protein